LLVFFSPSIFHSAHPFSRSYTRASFAPSAWADRSTHHPSDVNVESDDTSITLSLDVPGLSKEQLTVSIGEGIEGRILRIRAKDDAPRSFSTAYKLGSDVDASKTEAKLEHGVLTLKLTKVAPESRETLVTIN
jgi:HSP20 family protein